MANPNPVSRPGNLRPPWRKGESGNPAGSSRGRRRRAALVRLIDTGAGRAELAALAEDDDLAEEVAKAWLALALTGHWPSFKRLLDAVEGPVPPAPRRPRGSRW